MNKKILRIVSVVSLAIFVFLVCFVYWNEQRVSTINSRLFKDEKVLDIGVAKKDIYPSVDHDTYLTIQEVMNTKYRKPAVIEDSLRYFDIDNDGDKDIVGFLRFEESYRLFRTWYNTPSGFEYYENYSDGFRLTDIYDKDLSCSVDDIVVKRVTLRCLRQEQEYTTTLAYQKNDIGYYRDIEVDALVYKDKIDWGHYVSKRGGIDFKHPSDIEITEETYDEYGRLKTIIVGRRGNGVLFEIESVPDKEDFGGGILSLSDFMIFLKLSDGSYIARGWMVKDLTNTLTMKPKGAFYHVVRSQKNMYDENMVEVYDGANFRIGRKYTLYSPLTEEKDMKEIDAIFSSIQYRESVVGDDVVIPFKNNQFSFANLFTLQIPGNVIAHTPEIKHPNILNSQDFEIKRINAHMYSSTTLELSLLHFDSYDVRGHQSGGGYDAESNSCYSLGVAGTTTLKTIGIYSVCEHGSGGDDVSSHGYFIIDPNHRFIIDISETLYAIRTGSFFDFYKTSSFNLEDIIKSIKFIQ